MLFNTEAARTTRITTPTRMLNKGQIKGISVIAALPFLPQAEAVNKTISRSVMVSTGFPALNSHVAADIWASLNCEFKVIGVIACFKKGKIIHLSTRTFKDNSANDLFPRPVHTPLYAIA